MVLEVYKRQNSQDAEICRKEYIPFPMKFWIHSKFKILSTLSDKPPKFQLLSTTDWKSQWDLSSQEVKSIPNKQESQYQKSPSTDPNQIESSTTHKDPYCTTDMLWRWMRTRPSTSWSYANQFSIQKAEWEKCLWKLRSVATWLWWKADKIVALRWGCYVLRFDRPSSRWKPWGIRTRRHQVIRIEILWWGCVC